MLLAHIRNAVAVFWLLTLALTVSSCSGSSGQTSPENLSQPMLVVPADLPSLESLDQIHGTSAVDPVNVDPLTFLFSGGTVTEQTPNLLLDSKAGTTSWAMYSVPTVGKEVVSLSVSFTSPGDPGVWMACANFGSGRWEFKPMFTVSPAEFSVPAGQGPDFISTLGNFFFVVLSFDNRDAVLTEIVVGLDVPPPPTYSISGTVTDGSSGDFRSLQGILVALTPGVADTTTDANGNFSFSGLEAGSYTITPTDDGFTFDPLSVSPTITDADITGLSFVGTPVQQTVTYDADIAPLMDGSTGEKSCIGCHGGISPTLETFAQVSANADAINQEVNKSSDWMPPNGSKWSQDNLDLFQAWIDGGKLEQ